MADGDATVEETVDDAPDAVDADKGDTKVEDQQVEAEADGASDKSAEGGDESADLLADARNTDAEGSEGEGSGSAAPATWPDDWRQQLAAGDEKLLKRLNRFTAPSGILKSWLSAEKKISQGQQLETPGEDASAEELSAYRAALGVPETAEDYELNLPEGMVVGEEDMPIIGEFLNAAHENHVPNAAASQLVAWYYDAQDRAVAAQHEADIAMKAATEDKLRQEWGAEYRTNLGILSNYLQGAPEGVGDNLFGARLADGSLLGNNVEVMNWLVEQSRTVNPVATVMPNAPGNPGKALAEELAQIQKLMADDSSEYWEGPNAEAMQARYRELLDAQSEMNSRG